MNRWILPHDKERKNGKDQVYQFLFVNLRHDMKKNDSHIIINVLLCDTFPGRLPSDIPTYVTMFERLFSQTDVDVEFVIYMAMNGELPSAIRTDEIYLIPGCMYSAYDEFPWIAGLEEWIRDAFKRKAFLFGVCFGHQVIAKALGGTVEHYSGGWGTGVRQSHVVDSTLLEHFADGQLRLLYNHHDQVITPPGDAISLATSDFCRYEALRYGHHVFTFQGHPEYTPYYMGYYLNNLAADQDQDVVARALQSVEEMTPQGPAVARWLIEMFNRWLTETC